MEKEWYPTDEYRNEFSSLAKEELIERMNPVIKVLLDTDDSNERNKAALLLADYAGDLAVEPLIAIIKNPKTEHNRSTLLYALRELDYSKHYETIIDILFNSRWEARMQAFTLLEKLIEKGEQIAINRYQTEQLKKKLNKAKEEMDFYISVIELLM